MFFQNVRLIFPGNIRIKFDGRLGEPSLPGLKAEITGRDVSPKRSTYFSRYRQNPNSMDSLESRPCLGLEAEMTGRDVSPKRPTHFSGIVKI
jgi:hypothetical protein